jgi:hypothetical protein
VAITIIAPPSTQQITRSEDLQVFVTADTPALQRVILTIKFPGLGRSEQANNSDAISPPPNDTGYTPPYTSSLRAPFTDGSGTGYQFIIRRDFGWPDNPQVQVVAYDTAGGTEIFPP